MISYVLISNNNPDSKRACLDSSCRRKRQFAAEDSSGPEYSYRFDERPTSDPDVNVPLPLPLANSTTGGKAERIV